MTTAVISDQPRYKKPPVLEAVIAVHFAKQIEQKEIKAFSRKRSASFPNVDDVIEVSTSYNSLTNQTASNTKVIGQKLTSIDHSRIISINPDQLAVSHLAPYTDWDTLYSEVQDHWHTLVKITKRKTLRCVSTRFINRIDIPVDRSESVDLHKYFNLGLFLPSDLQTMELRDFQFSCSLLDPGKQYKYILQFSSMPSPLIAHVSFTIDIDIVTIGSELINEKNTWELIWSLRQHKNNLFESCITPATRELFL